MKLKKMLINITAAVCICVSLTGCTKVNENLSAKDIQKSIVNTGLVKNMEETASYTAVFFILRQNHICLVR